MSHSLPPAKILQKKNSLQNKPDANFSCSCNFYTNIRPTPIRHPSSFDAKPKKSQSKINKATKDNLGSYNFGLKCATTKQINVSPRQGFSSINYLKDNTTVSK